MTLMIDCPACGGIGEMPDTQEEEGCIHLVCFLCEGSCIVPDGTIYIAEEFTSTELDVEDEAEAE